LVGDTGYAFHDGDAGIMGTLVQQGDRPTGDITAQELAAKEAALKSHVARNTQSTKPKTGSSRDDDDSSSSASDNSSASDSSSSHGANNGIDDDDLESRSSSIETNLETTVHPANYTVCAPQLLHLDTSGRPLWFNGWLLPNKFEEYGFREPAQFDVFLHEPRERRDPEAWELRESNVCCLTADQFFEFTKGERAALDMIIDSGRQAGVFGKRRRSQ
jgi:hypothetical protein